MTDVLVRGVPKNVLDALKNRAASSSRSLQQELLLILEEAAKKESYTAARAAKVVRERLAQYGRTFSDSTELIREDRKR